MGQLNKNSSLYDSVVFDNKEIPIIIYIERRKSLRTSFAKESIIVRIPYGTKISMINAIEKCKKWILKSLNAKPELANQYYSKDYKNKPELLLFGNQSVIVNIEYIQSNKGNGKISNHQLDLFLPISMHAVEESIMIKKLISRCLAKAYKEMITDRVFTINRLHFNKDINTVRLKYNTSNWGSCSSQSNINLSTRLLLAPWWVIDYVISHELSHLYEMNHGPKFWKIVEKSYPNYQEAEAWLKVNGSHCHF